MTEFIILLLTLIGLELILGEGFHFKISKGYIYLSMFIAFIVNLIQIKTNTTPHLTKKINHLKTKLYAYTF